MNVQQPTSITDVLNSWLSVFNKLIDRTVLPLFVSYNNNQVGIGTIQPQTYSTTAVVVVSGTTTLQGIVSCSGMKLEGSVGSGSGTSFTVTAGKMYADCVPLAWGSFSAGTGPRSTYNISSTARAGAGQYTIKFNTSMTDTNYCIIGNGFATGAAVNQVTLTPTYLSATGFQLTLGKYDGSGAVESDFNFIVYGR